jgi:lipopolysaccharide transport protein LptA
MTNGREISIGLAAISTVFLLAMAAPCVAASTSVSAGSAPAAATSADTGTPARATSKGRSGLKKGQTSLNKTNRSSSDDAPSPFTAGHGPINIKSDTLSLDYKNNSVVFTGHVHAIQSGSELTTDTLRVNYEKNFKDIKDMVADGNVRISQGGRWATSDHAVMDQKAQTVVMTGNPVAHDGQDQISGTKITTYLQTGKSVVESANAMIFPKSSDSSQSAVASAPAAGPDDTPPSDDQASDAALGSSNSK